jgi:hypothetical protein
MNAQCSWPNQNCWLPEDHFPVELTRQHDAATRCLPVERDSHAAHRIDLAANPAAGHGADWSVWSGCWPTCWRGR